MVFESIIVDVLNKFLGNYVENLNRSQLKLGIWGGDVVLENLILKQNALEELQIPVQTVHGHLGKLVLKIPWKNLYGASVEATVENLFLIVNPKSEVHYDHEKEESLALAAKQAELQRVEEAQKKAEAEKDQQDKKIDETFVEKLVAQIIRNVQLTIKDIHIRYEDSMTNRKAPFSFGVTLHNLSVHTTDENWTYAVVQEAVTKIYKILSLEGLAIYLNPASPLYSNTEDVKIKLAKEIATKSETPATYEYLLGPISATAKLILNPKPEADTPKFSIPKVLLDLHMEQLSVNLSRLQYQDLMLLADSMDRASKAAPFRMYRPNVKSYRGYYKEWWKFAITCVIQNDVKRKHENWNWDHMLNHRNLCKKYAEAYRAKLNNGARLTVDDKNTLEHCEKKLDLFNLVLIRQRIALEVERLGKLEEKAKKNQGWFSWWYGTDKESELNEETDILKQFEKAMTPAEKEKLCRAIDYQENSAPLHLPTEYVAFKCYFMLDRLQCTVTKDKQKVLRACIDKFKVGMLQRPSANAIRVDVSMELFTILGVVQGELEPQIVLSRHDAKDENLLNVTFETKPIDGRCDQRIKVRALPLQIVYDAQTVIETVNVFKSPFESTALTTLQAAAENKLSDLKEKSTLGMQYAVHKHTFIDIDIDIAASHIIVPLYGLYKGAESCVVVKLGAIRVKSEPRSEELLSVHKMVKEGLAVEDIMHHLSQQSYDKLALQLSEIQIVVAMAGENWETAIVSGEPTPLHLLQPSNLIFIIHKCLITDDPRLPKIKVKGELEKIAFSVSEQRLLTLCEIIISMPLPNEEESAQLKPTESKASSLSLLKYLDPVEKQKRDSARVIKENEQSVQLTEIEAFFVMKELNVMVIRKLDVKSDLSSIDNDYSTLLNFSLHSLEMTAVQKTFTLETTVRLGSVSLQFHMPGDKLVQMIQTPDEADLEDQYLFTVTYKNVDKKCPEFRSTFASVEQMIELDFKTLVVLFHLECLQKILVIINQYQTRLQDIQMGHDRVGNAGAPDGVLETIMEVEESLFAVKSKASITKRPPRKQVESIQLKVNGKISAIKLIFATNKRMLSDVELTGMTAGLILKSSYTQVQCSMASIRVGDLNPHTVHKEILKVLGGDIINVQIVMYNLDQYPKVSDVNMSIEAQINCMRIIFLNWFVSSMLEFLDNFQTAQQAIIDASSQAADAARANVQNAYENATKVSLQIRFAAPIIVVPENSKSYNAIMFDFGRMMIKNNFVDHNIPTAANQVTVDELVLELENMQVSYINMQSDNKVGNPDVTSERELLRPTSFKLFVKRNLSLWYENLPDLDVSGRMKTIAITIAHSDYKSIMKILNQNLQEGQKKVEEKKSITQSQPSFQARPSKVTVKSQQSKMMVKAPTVTTPTPQVKDNAKTKTKFCFTMESFIIDLVTTQKSDILCRNSVGLARFCLALLSVKGRILSDDSMHTAVLLVDCTLDDMRPDRGDRITRYLERRRDVSRDSTPDKNNVMMNRDKIRSMLDITYTTKDSDTFVDLRIFSFNLILAMDFLNKIAEFTKVTLEEDEEGGDTFRQEESRPSLAKGLDKGVGDVGPAKKISFAKSEIGLGDKAVKKPSMTINIKIEQPDIFLVESLEQRNCDALVLNMEVRFKMRQTEGAMRADGGISGLQMVVRTFDQSNPTLDHAPRYLLAPAHVSLAACQTPDRNLHVDIDVSDIKITMSPEIISLLNRVMATVTDTEGKVVNDDTEIIIYKNLWDAKPFYPTKYWFLKTEMAAEAITLDAEMSQEIVAPSPASERCLISSPSIIFSMEMEIGSDTVPALVMQASLNAHAKNWSSALQMEMTWAMQMSYYNIKRAVWEPLIEPVEVLKDYQYVHVPFELKVEVLMRPQDEPLAIDSTDEASTLQAVAVRRAATTLSVSSSEPLEITVSTTGLEVLNVLGNTFSAAAEVGEGHMSILSKRDDRSKKYYGAPYVLHNSTGLTAKLQLHDNHDFTVFLTEEQRRDDYRDVILEAGASVPLQLKRGGLNLIKLNEPPPQLKLNVKIVEINEDLMIPVERADKRYFPLKGGKTSNIEKNVPFVAATEPRGLICDVIMMEGALQIYLRSIVQVINTLSMEVCVYYMSEGGNEARSLGAVRPGGTLRLPLQAVHTPTAEILFSIEGFSVSVSSFIWRELQHEVRVDKLLQCDSRDKRSGEKFYIKAVGKMEQVFLENTNRHTFASSCYEIKLKPVVKLQNCLPVEITVSQLGLKRTQTFQPGEMLHLSHLAPNKASIVLTIPNYLEKCWVCTRNLPDETTELCVWSFQSHDSPTVMTLELGMHSVNNEGTQMLSLYCPFWMLNKTGLTLSYRAIDDTSSNIIFHPKDYTEPILFSFYAKNFFGKNKASIRVEFGEWSEKFSLDLPGSSGVVICKNNNKAYQVAVTNQLTFNSLTKMVILSPFFQIVNKCPFPIEYQELYRPGDPWDKVESNTTVPLWPSVEKEDKLLRFRVANTTDITSPIIYTEQNTSCLKLNNEFGGLHVEMQTSEGGTYVNVRQYRTGHAPALLVNYTPYPVTLYEKRNVNERVIESMTEMLYAWHNPAGSRTLIFEGYQNTEIENDLRQDGFGEYSIDAEHKIYWVSFLDGLQRVVLFTDDPILASGVHTIGESELIDKEIVISLHGIGLSLVNDPEHLEIIYMTISNSGIIWEQCKQGARRYKKIDTQKIMQFEKAYQRYLSDLKTIDEVSPRVQIDEKTEVDFENMLILKPSPRLLRRNLQPGLWVSYGLTAHSRRIHARMHRLQIDQQLPLPTFPVVLAPVPPPRSVASDVAIAGMRPFVEISIVERVMEFTNVRQYKYFKILVQEFHVKVDMGLINALMGMFPQPTHTEQEALEAFVRDLETAKQPMEAMAELTAASEQDNFYDIIHLSPLKVHFSFSLGGATSLPTFIGTILQSIGVTLTDTNDVVFKLSYYERRYEFLSQKDLITEVQKHYTGQALKQLYVLVLGLDVIGNPYGLVIGLKKGVEDLFYEPFQGAIQGPGEFAEGLLIGVRSLVGHTVGGAAGAVSRITGAMGHGLAALSLDKDFQRRRRENINKTPSNLQEGLARSGKGLVMGVYDGVTGVFTKPLEGAQEQGFEGFFKGLGKGAVGLVTRPTAGFVDFASGSLDAVKRATDPSEDLTKRRAARYLPTDSGVRPYSRSHAEGYKMLLELEKGKFVATDTYEAHVWVIQGKEVVMCTDKRIMYLEKNTVFGGWQIVWSYLWPEIPELPSAITKGVYIPVAKKKVLGMFSTSGAGKVIFLYDEQQKRYLLTQCERLINLSR